MGVGVGADMGVDAGVGVDVSACSCVHVCVFLSHVNVNRSKELPTVHMAWLEKSSF